MICYLKEDLIKLHNSSSTNVFFEAASNIGTYICKNAYWAESQCNWIGRSTQEMASTGASFALANRALGPEVYDGTSGIALFLSYLYKGAKEEEYLQTARGAIRQALEHVKNIDLRSCFGFYTGSVGIAYVATRIGVMLEDEQLLQNAISILKNLAADGIYKQQHFLDVISGNAGAIPALLKMYDSFKDHIILDLALDLGNELISSATKDSIGWSWDSKANGAESTQHNLTGFSHGAAGIGYGLLELFNKTDKKEYRYAAEQAFSYENNWFSEKENNWPDFRKDSRIINSDSQEPVYGTAWCHGAPGIGLSRLYAYKILKEEKYMKDSLAALSTIRNLLIDKDNLSQHNYSLCHGLAGICEPLIYASEVFHDDSYKSLATDIGLYGIEKYENPGLHWPCGIPNGETPDLMLGLAGIGYFYLRLYDPQIPSIVMLTS
jgi:lantibiotic biosynthesis protein